MCPAIFDWATGSPNIYAKDNDEMHKPLKINNFFDFSISLSRPQDNENERNPFTFATAGFSKLQSKPARIF